MTRAFVVPDITLDPARHWPLRQQIHAQRSVAIRHGSIPHGARLPSSRLLAKILGVARNTVVDAYERLLEDGLIISRPGSGVQVSHLAAHAIPGFANLRETARAAHYPARVVQFLDPDGTVVYLNARR